jgi:chemotaxis protein CheD
MAVSETMVRMGELAVSSAPGHVLVSLGLGSCIGLALLDRRMGIAGLAHIVLPQSNGHANENPRKFADLAVPELVARTVALGTARTSLKAVLVGGAQMFALGGGNSLDIGVRNEAAVRGMLAAERIPVIAAATRGNKGRTIKVWPGGAIVAKEAGGVETELLAGDRR